MIEYQIRRFIFASLLLVGLTGCSTMRPIDSGVPKDEVISGIAAGDQIEIKTKTGEIRSISVSSVSDTHIKSGDEQFLINETEIVAHKKLNTGEKLTAVGLGLAVGVLTQALLMALVLGLAF